MQPLDLDSRYQEFLRLNAGGSSRGYTCPICSEYFKAGPRLWDHAKKAHGDTAEVTDYKEEAEAKKRFLERGQLKAAPRKAEAAPIVSKASLHQSGYKNTNIRSGDGPIPPDRPSSGPGYTQEPREEIGHIGDATMEQEEETGSRGKFRSSNNPRKRVAGDESDSPDVPAGGHPGRPMSGKERYTKSFSTGHPVGMDPDSSHQQPIQDSEFFRDTSDPKKPLWDPATDPTTSTTIGKGFGKDRDQGHADLGRRPQPPKNFISSTNEPVSFQQDKRLSDSRFGIDRSTTHPSLIGSNLKSTQPVNLERGRRPSSSESLPVDEQPELSEAEPEMLHQPETRPISHEQLVIEVKGIYAGLVMVEAKCIDIDERQSAAAQEKDPSKKVHLKNDQWQSLIALHKQLLHEHHDFFLASQHPSASPALSRLAAKYSMPARMWRHGIHAFLEVLRHRLPESLEHMLAFIYIAYTMMALLYETVSAFEDTWIECLGDLGRYRMAIEDDEPRDRETWSNVAQFWYNKAADKGPNVGRLYHHLAILARPYSLEQLSLYSRALTCVNPFESARGSIMTLFNPILNGKDSIQRRSYSFETGFIRVHGILFTSDPLQHPEKFSAAFGELQKDDSLDHYIRKTSTKFKDAGAHAAVANAAALFEHGSPKQGASKPVLRLAFEEAVVVKQEPSKAVLSNENLPVNVLPNIGNPETDFKDSGLPSFKASLSVVAQASKLAFYTLGVALRRPKDKNVYPLVHVYFVFLRALASADKAWTILEKDVPWSEICTFLNSLVSEYETIILEDSARARSRLRSKEFPKPEQGICRPLPEDFILRGQIYTQRYHPATLFSDSMVDEDERSIDPASNNVCRVERMLWLAHQIVFADRWIRTDTDKKYFTTTDYVNVHLNADDKAQIMSNDNDTTMMDIDTSGSDVEYTPSESSTMSDAESAWFTPESTSVVPSDSGNAINASTRASTPTEVPIVDAPAGPSTPKAIEPEESIEDTPMADISPGKGQQNFDLSEVAAPDYASKPQDTGILIGTSPPSLQPFNNEFLPSPKR